MKPKNTKGKVETQKIASITVLFLMAMLIILIGGGFAILSILRDIRFSVMGSTISGAVFGSVILFLGVRYLISVQKLKKEVYKQTSRFSWENFKSDKTRKTGNSKTEPLLTKYWMKG